MFSSSTGKQILVLGASGFLGRIVYHKLTLNNKFESIGTFYTSKADELIQLNVLSEEAVKNFFLYNYPYAIIWALKDMINESALSAEGLDYIIKYMPSSCKLIYLSTNVFNDGFGNKKETDPPAYTCKGHPADSYILSKIAGEKKVLTLNGSVVIRPGVIYGRDHKGKWDHGVENLINTLSFSKQIDLCNQRISTWVDVDFLADLIIKLIDHPFSGILHVGSPENREETGYSINKKIAEKLKLDTGNIFPKYQAFVQPHNDSFDLSLMNTLLRVK